MSRTLRIGIFTAIGVFLIVGFSIYVNDQPYWYRSCNGVKIHVDDATGLRRKSPVKTLGLEIGYIDAVTLDGDKVLVKVCVTGPVQLNSDTRAYIRSTGFLGDKFLELKPVDLLDGKKPRSPSSSDSTEDKEEKSSSTANDKVKNTSAAPVDSQEHSPEFIQLEKSPEEELQAPIDSENTGIENAAAIILSWAIDQIIPSAHAEEKTLNASREAELQDTIKKVGKLIDQLTLMVGDLREVTQQKDFKETIVNLNAAMKHLELLLRPTGKTVKNLDAAMESLKNTMASAENLLKKAEAGEGTVGKLLTDPSIYEEMKSAIRSVNMLLGKAGSLRTFIDLAAYSIPAYDGNKAKFSIMIEPEKGRYYLLGITSDPRGRDKKTTTTTAINGGAPLVEVKTVNEEKGLRITALLGKYFFGHIDLAVGLIEDNGAVRAGFWLDENRKYGVLADVFSPGKGEPITARVYAKAHVWSGLYAIGGIDSHRKYNGSLPVFFGAGLFFDDDDLKYLLAFK